MTQDIVASAPNRINGADGRGQRALTLDGPPRPLLVHVGEDPLEIHPHELLSEEAVREHSRRWRDSATPIVFDIRHVPDWRADARWAALSFLARVEHPHTFRSADDGPVTENLLQAVVAMMVGPDSGADRCRNGLDLAIEAAAILHPRSLNPACNQIMDRLQALGVRGHRIGDLVRSAERMVRAAHPGSSEADGAIRILEIFPDCPVSGDLIAPPGWRLALDGVQRSDASDRVAAITIPVVLTRRLVNAQDGTESVELAWHRDGRWQRRLVGRDAIASNRKIIDLAQYGLPVTSNNATQMIQYLAEFEAVNQECLPVDQVTRHLGWQGDSGFMWGHTLLPATAANQTATTETPSVSGGLTQISFQGRDGGEEQLAGGFRTGGTMERWLAALSRLSDYPRVQLGVVASLAVGLLRPLGARNFTLSFDGATSLGKTITLRVAGSCWGCPDEGSPESVIGTWDASRTWIERAMTVLNDLPLILDDTKKSRRPQDISQTIYDVTSGRGRGRGSCDGIRATGTFRTILISSGEAPIASFTQDGGTRARVLQVWGSPFRQASIETAANVTRLNEAVLANFGHAGPAFIRYVVANQTQWPVWQDAYRGLRTQFAGLAADNSVAARMGEHFAVLSLTEGLAHNAQVLPWRAGNLIDNMWGELIAGTREADRAEVALRHVWSWAIGHQEEFWALGRRGDSSRHTRDWAGRWDGAGTSGQWGYLGLLEHRLIPVLQERGFEPDAVIRLWRDRGWLEETAGRGMGRYRCRISSNTVDMIAIRREAIDEVVGPQQAEAAHQQASRLGGVTGGQEETAGVAPGRGA